MNKARYISIVFILFSSLLAGLIPAVNIARAALSGLQPDPEVMHSAPPGVQQAETYSVTFSGNSHFSEKDLLKSAADEMQKFKEKGHRKADIDDAAFRMRLAYLEAGFAFAGVDYTYAQKDNVIHVLFDIEEGPRVFIQQVNFEGNLHVTTETLYGFFPKLTNGAGIRQKAVFSEAEVKDAVSRIREYYRGQGFADVAVKKPALAFNESRSGVTIAIAIEEGPQYIINAVELKGDLIPELANKLEETRNFFIGKPYYVRRKLLLRTTLEEAYDAIGYADAKFDIQAIKPDAPGKIDLVAEIKSGNLVRIGAVAISGNESTRDTFIRDRVQMKPGDIYTNAKRRESFRKLFDSGLFAKISIELSPSAQESRRDLEVAVEELPSREVYVEPGWGSYEELRLRAGVFEKNLLGTGRNGRIEGLVSTKGETLTLSYSDPWLLQTDIIMNVPLYFERRDEPSYTFESTSLSVLFSRKLSRNLTLSTGYQYKITQLFSLADQTPLPKGEDDYNNGTVGIQAVWDSRDDIFYPTEGVRFASGLAFSSTALGGDLEFGRITLGCRYFIKLPREYILGMRATAGLIIPMKDQIFIPISERFFNGGDNTVRSYKHSKLGPKDEGNEPIGGLGYNVFSIELRKRFYRNFATTLYVDAGNVSPNKALLENDFMPYTSRSELLDDTLKDFFSEFKFGIGIGFQYLLPVGPLRFDIAYNLDPEDMWQEDTWVYHFSLGMAF